MSVRSAAAFLVAMCSAQVATAAELSLAPPAQTFDWTGVYIGANLGYGSGGTTTTLTERDRASTASFSGAIAGAQIGANYQRGAVVFGFEIDAEWSSQKSASPTDAEATLPWLATARARIGAAYDRIQYFASAGVGIMHVNRAATTNDVVPEPTSDTRPAWVVGIGSESAVNRNVILRFEVLYLQAFDNPFTGSTTTTSTTATTPTTAATTTSAYDIIGRVGLSYKFGLP